MELVGGGLGIDVVLRELQGCGVTVRATVCVCVCLQ